MSLNVGMLLQMSNENNGITEKDAKILFILLEIVSWTVIDCPGFNSMSFETLFPLRKP